jgi:hypothetical protein
VARLSRSRALRAAPFALTGAHVGQSGLTDPGERSANKSRVSPVRCASPVAPMLARKFDVGQSVYLRPNLSTRNAAFGVYEIRATLPAEDREFRYRIKSQIELHERVVKESELSKA